MQNPSEKPAAQVALEEAHGIGPLTVEDQQAYDDLQGEIDSERAKTLTATAQKVGKLVEANGVIVPEDVVAQELAAGHDMEAHVTAGRQS